MSNNIERQKELSRKLLIPGEPKPSGQKASSQIQVAPMQLIHAFSLGAISGLAIFVLLCILGGFSKLAIMLPFVGGILGIAIEMIRRKNKA